MTQQTNKHHLQLVPELEVEYFLIGPLIVPRTHLVNVRGVASVCHAQDLIGQSAHKGDRVVDSFKPRDGNGGGLVQRLPVMNLTQDGERVGGFPGTYQCYLSSQETVTLLLHIIVDDTRHLD